MVGSQVYDDHGHHHSGVPDVATYVNTRGGLVVADRDGTVALQKADSETQRWDFYSCDLVTQAATSRSACDRGTSLRPEPGLRPPIEIGPALSPGWRAP